MVLVIGSVYILLLYNGPSPNSIVSVMAPDWVSMNRTVVRKDCGTMYAQSANRRNGLVGMLYSV